ncbi:hypothetical protein L0N14_00205 [Faecalibacillus faecis]|uniref:hypothetical protein n=1 Tax=Faecalibacillus faecis TaxID=1982628 RepID=UPI001D06301A|nr:hypothetical protein [Faecalibacillus faecis]MCG4591739.1 hypothetical protein [Faecalibacillus faecis]
MLGLDLTNIILSLSFQKLSKILQGTYFEDVDFLKTLEYLYGGKINTNKAGKKKYEDQFVLFEESLLNKYRNIPAYKWLNNYFDTNSSSYSEIFYSAGILKDDLSNFCYICHIQPIDNIGIIIFMKIMNYLI